MSGLLVHQSSALYPPSDRLSTEDLSSGLTEDRHSHVLDVEGDDMLIRVSSCRRRAVAQGDAGRCAAEDMGSLVQEKLAEPTFRQLESLFIQYGYGGVFRIDYYISEFGVGTFSSSRRRREMCLSSSCFREIVIGIFVARISFANQTVSHVARRSLG